MVSPTLVNPPTTNSCMKSFTKQYLPFITAYLVFGLLHELSHVVIASILLGSSLNNNPFTTFDNLYQFVVRALLGRYCLIEAANDDDGVSSTQHLVIRHFGWIFSIVIAMGLHWYHRRRQNSSNVKDTMKISLLFSDPIIVVAAYVTALESITTDLFSFAPINVNPR